MFFAKNVIFPEYHTVLKFASWLNYKIILIEGNTTDHCLFCFETLPLIKYELAGRSEMFY